MMMIRKFSLFSMVGLLNAVAHAATIADFEDLDLAPEAFYNGSDGAGGFTSRGAFFNNTFTDFGGGFTGWEGFAYSNRSDTTTPGFGNQYSAFTGAGFGGGGIYGVGFVGSNGPPTVTLPSPSTVGGAYFTNTTYTALSMRDGDAFAKKFGGASGDDPDWFRLTITGLDGNDQETGTVEFYAADFRFGDNNLDYIVDTWTFVDLTSLGTVSSLQFGLSSSDVGQFGMNTPAYFALDNLAYQAIPEPASLALFILGSLLVRRRSRGR